MSLKKSAFIIVLILLIDQISKIYIKTHFALGDEYRLFDWFRIYFVENDGMAWGTKISDFASFISDRTAKIALTIFRIVAIIGIGYWLLEATKKKRPKVFIVSDCFSFRWGIG
jgi:signal peptidase II